jgi:hypothetical protein
MSDFFELPVESEETLKKREKSVLEAQKKKTPPAFKSQADESAVDLLSDQKFNLEVEKQNVVDSLNKLKALSVEEFTFLKKYEEIKLVTDYNIFTEAPIYKSMIWSPANVTDEEKTISEINSIVPSIEIVDTKEKEKIWNAFRLFCHTAEYNQAPGRFIRVLLKDTATEKYLGFASIASEVISISCRDEWLGWTQEDRLKHKMLNHSAIGTTIAATQPFGSLFLGGKLMAAMLTTKTVRDYWYNTYDQNVLVGMTTTSLYGAFSMYNSHKWWKPVGKTKGKIPLKPEEKYYEVWHRWLKQNRTKEYNEKMTQKEGISGPVTGAKMRVLGMIFDAVGIRQSDYVHGYERGVYYSCFYENTKDFLQRKITQDKLVLKPHIEGDVQSVCDWWKPKAIERYKKLKSEGRLNVEKLFYDDMKKMKNFDEAKVKYFSNVGK